MQNNQRLRIKVPRSVVVTKMQRKFNFLVKDKASTAASDDDRDNVGTRFTCGSQFSRKSVGSAFSCVLGNKTSYGNQHASKVKKKKEPHGGDLGKGKLSQLLALDETDGEVEGKQKRKKMQRAKMNIPLLSFLYNKSNSFMRTKGSNDHVHGDGNNVVTRFRQVRSHLVRIPSKILVFRIKLKTMKYMVKKKETKQLEQEGDDEENDERELCKKRILMGGRCRPLTSPGYDTYNFFKPRGSSLTSAQHSPF